MLNIKTSDYLKELGLEQYIQAFEDEEIGIEEIPDLTESNLKSMGMKLGHIKKLLKNIQSINNTVNDGSNSLVLLKAKEFPSLISAPLFDYINELNPKLRLWAICDFIELSLRLVVVTGLAQIRKSNEKLPDIIVREISTRIEHPTLGKWMGMAVAISKDKSVSKSLKETVSLLQHELEGSGKANEENSLLTLRNFLAHGGNISQSIARKLLTIWEPKFESLISNLNWFSSFQILAKDGTNIKLLKGSLEDTHIYKGNSEEEVKQINSGFAKSKNVVLKIDNQLLSLWPLYFYEDREAYMNPVQNIFVRRGELFLEYTPVGSNQHCQFQSDKEALDSFVELFRLGYQKRKEYEKQFHVRSFESEFLADSKRFVGRKELLSQIMNALCNEISSVYWITGNAGIGKSYLMAATTFELIENQLPFRLILPYRFKAGDDRCYRNEFIIFAVERLNVWDGVLERINKRTPTFGIEDLSILLNSIKEGNQVLFILDGMDELPEKDQILANEICEELNLPSTKWLCSGRTNPKLDSIFNKSSFRIFPEGVPGMDKNDVQSMIYEKIGPLRKKVIIREYEQERTVVNPFIDQVWKYSKGIPLYVTYVIGDILSNRIKEFDGHSDQLPPSIFHYHQELVRRCSIGLYQQILPRLIANIAIAKEALTIDTLQDILVKEDYLPESEKTREIMHNCLTYVSPMLKKLSSSDNEGEGFILYHMSLLDYLKKDDESKIMLHTARKSLIKLIKNDETPKSEADIYLLRWGISHLLEDNQQHEDLITKLLGSSNYLQDKYHYQKLEYFFDDLYESYLYITDNEKRLTILESFLTFIGNNVDNHDKKIEIEDIHALFVYRPNQRFYEHFLNYSIEKLEDEKEYRVSGHFMKIYPSFLLRKANLLRRKGNLRQSQALLEKALNIFKRVDNTFEIEKLEYDIAYIAYLLGDTEDAFVHFEKSKQYAIHNDREVGYWISYCVQAHACLYDEKNNKTYQEYIDILQEALPYFIDHSRKGNENAKRWIKNIYQQMFLAAYEIKNKELAEECYEKMINNEWIQKYDEGNLDKFTSRLHILRREYELALEVFASYLHENSIQKESYAREFLEYSRLLLSVGKVKEAQKVAEQGLKCPIEFGNRYYQKALQKLSKE